MFFFFCCCCCFGAIDVYGPKTEKKTRVLTRAKRHDPQSLHGQNVRSVLFSCRVRTQFFCRVNGLLVSETASIKFKTSVMARPNNKSTTRILCQTFVGAKINIDTGVYSIFSDKPKEFTQTRYDGSSHSNSVSESVFKHF